MPLLNLESLALAALAVRCRRGWAGSLPAGRRRCRSAAAIVHGRSARPPLPASVVVYLASIAIVDVFQTRVEPGVALVRDRDPGRRWRSASRGSSSAREPSRWASSAGSALARGFGLALLAVATAKVFLFDLAALDVAYRVLSFIGLGGVLLASSFVAAHFRAPRGQSPA